MADTPEAMGKRGYTIHEMAEEDRPRERLEKYGVQALRTDELLAILLRVGVKGESAIDMAARLLHDLDGLGGIDRVSVAQLKSMHGLGRAKACQLKAAVELGARLSKHTDSGRPIIRNAEDVSREVMAEMRRGDREQLVALLLDTRGQLISKRPISTGTLTGSAAHPREIFKEAVTHSAASLVLVHNHPSGDPTPSRDDLLLTERMVKAGELMGVSVVDHVIIGDGRYVSLKETGRM